MDPCRMAKNKGPCGTIHMLVFDCCCCLLYGSINL